MDQRPAPVGPDALGMHDESVHDVEAFGGEVCCRRGETSMHARGQAERH